MLRIALELDMLVVLDLDIGKVPRVVIEILIHDPTTDYARTCTKISKVFIDMWTHDKLPRIILRIWIRAIIVVGVVVVTVVVPR
jgi:hypothetical protein